MPRTVTLRLDDETYRLFKAHAAADNRPLSNMIETAAKRHLEGIRYVSEAEQKAIERSPRLIAELKSASRAAKEKRGRWVD